MDRLENVLSTAARDAHAIAPAIPLSRLRWPGGRFIISDPVSVLRLENPLLCLGYRQLAYVRSKLAVIGL